MNTNELLLIAGGIGAWMFLSKKSAPEVPVQTNDAGGAPGAPSANAVAKNDVQPTDSPILISAPTLDSLGGYYPAGGYGKQWGNRGNGDYFPGMTPPIMDPVHMAGTSERVSAPTAQGGYVIGSGYR